MTTLTELKNRKQVKAKRIDNNFVTDAEKIEQFENQVKLENLQILDKQKIGNHIEYTLLKACECVHKYSYASWHETEEQKEEFLQDIVNRCDLPVIKSYRDNEFVYIVTDGQKSYFNIALNNPTRAKVMDGMLVFRSNDYYFQYENGKIYGDVLRASQIQDNKIIIKLGNAVDIEYIMEL